MRKIIIISIISMTYVLFGCTALAPFPHAARSGDTIALGVGPHEGMTKPNTRVYYTPDSTGVPITMPPTAIRAIFNIYADKTSLAYSTHYGYVDEGFKYLHHEPWETVIAVDLPSLPVGTGTISFQTSVQQPNLPLEPSTLGNYPDLNTISIPLEILPGTGMPNPFDYALSSGASLPGDLNALRQQRQALVKPPIDDLTSSWGTPYGAIEFNIDLPMLENTGGTASDDSIRVVAQDVSTFTKSKSQMSWAYDGVTLKVFFISSSGNLRFFEPRFSIIAETADFTATPTINSVAYYDVNGNEIFTGPSISDYAVSVFGVYPP